MNSRQLKAKAPLNTGSGVSPRSVRSRRTRKALRGWDSGMNLSSMPFETIIALSRRPELLRAWLRGGLVVVLFCALSLGAFAQEKAEPKVETKAAYTNAAPEVKPAVSNAPPAAVVASTNTSAAKSTPKSNATAVSNTKSSTPAVAPNSYDAFRVVADRNIFNPNRTRRSRAGDTEAPPPPPKVESFALVGTIQYEKGTFAFFDSTSSSYRKTAKAGDVIGDCKLKAVEDNKVTLEADGKDVEIKVGMQLRREEAGPWAASIRSETSSSFASSAPSSAFGSSSGSGSSSSSRSSRGGGDVRRSDGSPAGEAPAAPAPASTSGGDSGGASDLLKRLMEQRQREMNR